MTQFSLFGDALIPAKPLFKSSKVNPCEKCALAGKLKILDDGNIDTAEIIVVGEAPTSDTIFSNKGGQLLRTLLDKYNFTNLYFTNVVQCCPDNGIPQSNIVKSCRKNLEETLDKAVNKKLILVCGDIALYWFTKLEGKQHRGFFFNTKWGKVFSLQHPTHSLKNLNIKDSSGKDSLDFLAEDLKRAKTYIESGKTSIDISDKINIAKTHNDFIRMIGSMEHLIGNKDQRVGIDFETDSLEIYNPKINILSVSIAVSKDLVWCIPFKFIEDVSTIEEAYTVVKFIMDNINLLMHNAGFDLILGHIKFGCKLNLVDDTMLMYYLLDGNRGGSSKLKRLANDWTDFGDYGVEYEKMQELKEQELVEYNCKDAIVLLHLYDQFYNKMDYAMKFCYSQIIRKAQLTLIHASINGMKIDANYALSVQKNLQKEFDVIENTTKAYGLNLSSPKQVLAYLNQHRNIQVISTNQDTLEPYKKDEFVALLLRYRKVALLKRTYVEPMLLEHSKHDNLVHPQFNIGLTATGRISCSKPNLQNIPTRDGPLIEKMFIPRFEAGYIVKADYCVAPDTKILKADLTWVCADELKRGDELIGFDEKIDIHNKFKPSNVEYIKKLIQPCIYLETDQGSVTCSEHHRWLVSRLVTKRGVRLRQWVKTKELLTTDKIIFFSKPWERDSSYEAGWLAGLLDGEGWVYQGVGIGQNDGIIWTTFTDMLQKRGIKFKNHKNKNGCNRVRLMGCREGMAFIGSIRPVRLLKKSNRLWENRRTWNRIKNHANIVNITKVGKQDVLAIQTSTKTFIANGFFSHNSQMELRVACIYSNDRKMIEFFNSGKDIHRMTAVEIYGVPDEWFDSNDPEKRKKAKEARSIAKGFNFGVIYGRGAQSIAEELNINPVKAEQLRRKYFDLFPDLKRWIDTTQDQATQDGYVKSLFGRVRYIPEVKSDVKAVRSVGLREAINTPIQSVASDIALLGAYECVNELLKRNVKSKFINFIHDAMLFDVPKEELEEVICIIKEKAVNVVDNLKIPLEIDIKYGASWGDMEK
mgnify:CR=1 FL=1